MAKIDILFDNKNYNIDEASLSSASAKLKSHLSTVMSGSGSTIDFGGVTYNIDSAKLLSATNSLISHLGTISGSGYNVILNGVNYSVDPNKLSGAVAYLHTVLGGLNSGDDNDDGLNEYGFYFGKPYVCVQYDGAEFKMSFTFYEDGSGKYEAYIEGEYVGGEEMPVGIFTYRDHEILMSGDIIGTVNADGTQFTDADGYVYTLESSSNSCPIRFGEIYTLTRNNAYGNTVKIISVFYEDGSCIIETYIDNVLEIYYNLHLTYNGNEMLYDDEVIMAINSDGTEVTMVLDGGVLKLESVNEYGFYYDTKYSIYNVTADGVLPKGEIGFYFKENQTVDMYVDGTLAQTLPVTYSDKVITTPAMGATLNVLADGKELSVPSYKTFKIGSSVVEDSDYTYIWTDVLSEFIGGNCWFVSVNDKSKSSYETITNKPDGYPLALVGTFQDCVNMTTAPVIPSSVVFMEDTFYGCTNLTGNVEINCNPTAIEGCFTDTTKPITITGSCSDETKAALAATANNGNVSYNSLNEYGFYYGVPYVYTTIDEGITFKESYVFFEDGSCKLTVWRSSDGYSNVTDFPAGSVTYTIGEMLVQGVVYATISDDGTQIYRDGKTYSLE